MVGDLLFCRVFLGLVCISVLVGFAFRLFLVVWFSGCASGLWFWALVLGFALTVRAWAGAGAWAVVLAFRGVSCGVVLGGCCGF